MTTKYFFTRVRSRLAMLVIIPLFLTASSFIPATTIDIQVSPNVLNLINQGQWVTVHTDIAFGLVSASSVYLNGVLIHSWKSDLRGNFVAKFLMSEVKALDMNMGELNTLTLVGTSAIGDFWGSQDIKVIEVVPVKTGKD